MNNLKDKPLDRKLIEKQVEFIEKIQRVADVNLVNCGRCDSILFHDTKDEEIECPYCNFKSDPSDFPDYIYDGMVNNLCD